MIYVPEGCAEKRLRQFCIVCRRRLRKCGPVRISLPWRLRFLRQQHMSKASSDRSSRSPSQGRRLKDTLFTDSIALFHQFHIVPIRHALFRPAARRGRQTGSAAQKLRRAFTVRVIERVEIFDVDIDPLQFHLHRLCSSRFLQCGTLTWLRGEDSNLNQQVQSLLSCRWTTPQCTNKK